MQFMIFNTRSCRSFSLACAVWFGLCFQALGQVYQFRNYTAADADGLSDILSSAFNKTATDGFGLPPQPGSVAMTALRSRTLR
jgi:hypothetical protein